MFLALTEIYFSKKYGVQTRGHALIDIADVRKLTKVKDPTGEYCARISYKGLPSAEDIFVRETPENIRDMCKEFREMKAIPKVVTTQRVIHIEAEKPTRKATPIPKEFDEVFRTNAGYEYEEDASYRRGRR